MQFVSSEITDMILSLTPHMTSDLRVFQFVAFLLQSDMQPLEESLQIGVVTFSGALCVWLWFPLLPQDNTLVLYCYHTGDRLLSQ